VTPALFTGASPAAGTAVNKLPQPRLPVTVTVGGIPAAIQFEGIPTLLVGTTQINFVIPPGVPSGVQTVVVTSNGGGESGGRHRGDPMTNPLSYLTTSSISGARKAPSSACACSNRQAPRSRNSTANKSSTSLQQLTWA